MERRIEAGAILAQTGALIAANPVPALIALTLLIVPSVWLDTQPDSGAQGLLYVVSIISIFAQFQVTQALLRHAGLLAAEGKAGRGGSFFGVILLSGFAIALGMLALVLPGLYLFARWSIAVPVVIGEGQRSGEAFATSVDRTRGHLVPIMIALGVINVSWAAAAMLLFFGYPPTGAVPFSLALIANTLLYGGSVMNWYCAVAIYRLIGVPNDALEDVFA